MTSRKITMHFDLLDPDQRQDFNMAIKGSDAHIVLETVDQALRSKIKYAADLSEETVRHLQDIRDLLNSEANERGLNLFGEY